jgi:uncharacterized protein (TIGR03437 family)
MRSGRVLAIMNTTTAGAVYETGDFRCYSGQPCEITGSGFRYNPDTNYAVPIENVYRCFNVQGVFDVSLAECPLDNGIQLRLSSPPRAVRPLSLAGTVTPAWNVNLSGGYTYYRYKIVAEGRDDCRNSSGYSPAIVLAAVNRINDPLHAEDGRYYLCVLAGSTPVPDANWQQPAFATVVHTRVDSQPPTIEIVYTLRESASDYLFDPIFVLPELVDFRYKLGADEADTCDLPAGYLQYRRVPIRVGKASVPYRLCFTGFDEAGNATAPLEFRLRGLQIRPHGILSGAGTRTGVLARGSLSVIAGFNFGVAEEVLLNVPVSGSIQTAAGGEQPLKIVAVQPEQVIVQIPDNSPLGDAMIRLTNRHGTVAAVTTIVSAAPSIITPLGNGLGAPYAFASRSESAPEPVFNCLSASVCTPVPIDVPNSGDPVILTFFTSGLRYAEGAQIVVRIAGLTVPLFSVTPLVPLGIELVQVRIGPEFALRGFLNAVISAAGVSSNPVILRFR